MLVGLPRSLVPGMIRFHSRLRLHCLMGWNTDTKCYCSLISHYFYNECYHDTHGVMSILILILMLMLMLMLEEDTHAALKALSS